MHNINAIYKPNSSAKGLPDTVEPYLPTVELQGPQRKIPWTHLRAGGYELPEEIDMFKR